MWIPGAMPWQRCLALIVTFGFQCVVRIIKIIILGDCVVLTNNYGISVCLNQWDFVVISNP